MTLRRQLLTSECRRVAFSRTFPGSRRSGRTLWRVTRISPRSEGTLLRALVRERRLTVQEALDALQQRAELMNERSYALSDRQLRRWLAGDVASLNGVRPANIRVAEAEFGWPIGALLADDQRPTDHPDSAPGPKDRELRTKEFISWVAEHSALSYEAAYRAVTEGAEKFASVSFVMRAACVDARAQVGRAQIADAVADYYGHSAAFYSARVGQRVVHLSVLTNQDWVGLAVPLGGGAESCAPAGRGEGPAVRLSDSQARSALDRLAAAEVTGTVMVNNSLYRLSGLEIGRSHLAAQFECAEFAVYALTADLLEAELRDLTREEVQDPEGTATPLRDAWLPTVESGLAFERRVCVGGPVCLVAIADGEQYQLLVQERSNQVLNVTGTLAVIPKAFHQPIVDAYGETRISTTIERELEEELFGRVDLEQRSAGSMRRAAPLHPFNASAPMKWLRGHPDSWRMECTGFGINMVTGNYEFSCLVVIEDPAWWTGYGHLLEANWEASRLHRYSSLDSDGITHLIGDTRWSNEGLLALIEGLRRLGELDSSRVRLPAIERIS